MSNYSGVYQVYLTGYAGVDAGAGSPTTERLAQALALGVHHRVTSKPPLMSSVAVTAELCALKPKTVTAPVSFTRLLLVGISRATKIHAIKNVKEISNMGLREAKDIVNAVELGKSQDLASTVAGWWRPELTPSERLIAAAKLLREAGCTVEVS